MRNRKAKLLSDAMEAILIKQAAHEMKNFILYNGFANYFAIEGIDTLDEYFHKRAEEEENHYYWIQNYLKDCDGMLIMPAIEANKELVNIPDMVYPFIATVEREIQTTNMIYAIKDLAISEKDYMTNVWLNEHLIREQIEEENTSRMALAIMEKDADLFEKAEEILELLED